ncbi:hypothetical protein ACI68E_003651 [Malassezia pachydermatis]|uniref:Uncharacterized protein n=1 Tax=Malassezia pachydermatis TaxID=77020 RepID=A0A0M9VNJ2_9BASI|nr:hypothetical protein Malapachy_0185 [Malassezia pachydermatis]KOS13392.1 hypothetical protein Malapachy_0185 [Malassezia pachydermatis]
MSAAEGDVASRLWSVVQELSAQISSNKEEMESLREQLHSLQGQAVHERTGFALRRFNVDLSQEEFLSQIERLNTQLATENTKLAHETKQLGMLLREYETTLETVMGKFRAFSYAAQQHSLDLTAYYENRLNQMKSERDTHAAKDDKVLHDICANLGSLVRSAMMSLDGDESPQDVLETKTELERLRQENDILRSMLGIEHDHPTSEHDDDRLSLTNLSVARTHVANAVDANVTAAAPVDAIDAGVPANDTAVA